MKTLVVGEAPSRWMEENRVTIPLPLARRELAALAGLIPPKFDELFEFINVFDKWPGKQGKGDAFPLTEARVAAAKLLPTFAGRKVILLGTRVAKAFYLDARTLLQFGYWEWTVPDGSRSEVCEIAICPHPSGVNTWWNKPENRVAARIFWGSVAQERTLGNEDRLGQDVHGPLRQRG